MNTLRLLENGRWSKPPIITAARRIVVEALTGTCSRTQLGRLAEFVNGTSYDTSQLSSAAYPSFGSATLRIQARRSWSLLRSSIRSSSSSLEIFWFLGRPPSSRLSGSVHAES
jgi:hypothetical protein